VSAREEPLEPDPPGTAALRRQLDVTAGARWREGNVVELDPAIDPERDMGEARTSLLVSLAASGWDIARRERFALVAATRARKGIRCVVASAIGVLDDAYVERLERMGSPVSVLPAEQLTSSFVVVDATRAVLPEGSRVELLEGAGHFLQYEEPARVTELVLEHLGDAE
jgi:pimeloyl-ACP methyl ester carboxylesterase